MKTIQTEARQGTQIMRNAKQERIFAKNISFAEVPNVAMALAQAQKITVHKENGEQLKRFSGIENQKTGEVKEIFGKEYWLVQHQDVLDVVSDTLTEIGLKGTCKIEVNPDGDRMTAFFLFDNAIIPDSTKFSFDPQDSNDTGIKYGIMVQNSWDGSSPLRVSSYGERLVCSNGMTALAAFTATTRMHTLINGKEPQLRPEIMQMVRSAINGQEKFKEIVENAMKDSYAFETMKELIAQLMDKEVAFKHLAKIFNDIGVSIIRTKDEKTKKWTTNIIQESNFNPSRWALYNAFTRHLTHDETIGYAMREHLNKVSERILTQPIIAR